jgi:hypothetical protein
MPLLDRDVPYAMYAPPKRSRIPPPEPTSCFFARSAWAGALASRYGFSSGAFFAYLLVLELERRNLPLPFRLFVAGRGAPHCVWSPEVVRTYRCADVELMDKMLHEGLGLQLAADDEDADVTERRHAWWRAPLLTSAVAVGERVEVDGPFFGGTGGLANRLGGASDPKDVVHAGAPPKAGVPIICFASTNDRVWPFGLPQRWEEVAARPETDYRLENVGKLSHFAFMTAEPVQELIHKELAAAAASQAFSMG